MSGRISAFKNKINRLAGENSNLAKLNIRKQSSILKYRENAKVLRDKIIDQDIKIIEFEESFTFQYLAAKEKEIILLKQEGQCKQVDIDSLVDKLYRANKDLRDKNEYIYKLNIKIRAAEDKKLKNRLKKLFIS